ncbi:MAG TPA: hypothetical protein VFA40_09840, partial [Terriglobales bacterium]|nr:hypothetical protein [Terriglobales bacterium]
DSQAATKHEHSGLGEIPENLWEFVVREDGAKQARSREKRCGALYGLVIVTPPSMTWRSFLGMANFMTSPG